MHFFIKKILEKKTRDLLCKSVWRFNDNCSLHLNTDTDLQYFGWNLSRQIQLLHLLSSMCFLESDHSIFSLLHFPLGKSTLGQAASCSPTTKVSERHLVANEISIQKKNLHKSIPIQVNVGSPEKRQSAQARAWMPGSKGNAPFIPTFFILSPSTQKLGYKSQSSWKRGVAPVWKCKKSIIPWLTYLCKNADKIPAKTRQMTKM